VESCLGQPSILNRRCPIDVCDREPLILYTLIQGRPIDGSQPGRYRERWQALPVRRSRKRRGPSNETILAVAALLTALAALANVLSRHGPM
jgi:hypothetical protein